MRAPRRSSLLTLFRPGPLRALTLLSVAVFALATQAQPQPERAPVLVPEAEPAAESAVVPVPMPAAEPALVPRPAPPIEAKPNRESAAVALPATRQPAPLQACQVGDAELESAWKAFRQDVASGKNIDAAKSKLLSLKEELGATDLDAMGATVAREALTRIRASELESGLALATVASQLAPSQPYVRVTYGVAEALSEPLAVTRYLQTWWKALRALISDPRYAGPLFADVGSAGLVSWVVTAIVVTGVIFARKLRYAAHDLRHALPKAVWTWQVAGVLVGLAALPLVFRWGWVPLLGGWFLLVTFYLAPRERVLIATLIAGLGLVPIVAGRLAAQTTFAGTAAEDAYLLERGGWRAERAGERLAARTIEGENEFVRLFVQARFAQRRGRTAAAIAGFKEAALIRAGDARVLTNLGTALMASGDVHGGAELYRGAIAADSEYAPAHFNLARYHYRQASALLGETAAAELEQGQSALTTAQSLDAELLSWVDPPAGNLTVNRHLQPAPLAKEVLVGLATTPGVMDDVEAQVRRWMVGDASAFLGLAYPIAWVLVVLAMGWGAKALKTSKACERCGQAVCRRCDPQLGVGSSLCSQCQHAFARKGVSDPAEKLRKQLEVRRFQARDMRVSYGMGLLAAGAGHVFSGMVWRGALFVFFFVAAAFFALFREGVVRTPYTMAPTWLRAAPFLIAVTLFYILSLRSLYRRLRP
ncbi:MAG: hypothetical protein ACKVPX_02315 [Myxococcaceae bacterium]